MYIFINLSHGVSLPSIITGVQKSIHTAPGSQFLAPVSNSAFSNTKRYRETEIVGVPIPQKLATTTNNTMDGSNCWSRSYS